MYKVTYYGRTVFTGTFDRCYEYVEKQLGKNKAKDYMYHGYSID